MHLRIIYRASLRACDHNGEGTIGVLASKSLDFLLWRRQGLGAAFAIRTHTDDLERVSLINTVSIKPHRALRVVQVIVDVIGLRKS